MPREPRRSREARPSNAGAGFTFIEVLLVATIAMIVAATAVPQTMATVERARARGAARYLASRMSMARTLAVSRSATVALRFENDPRGITFTTFIDGNGNGVRTRDIQAGVDREIDPAVLLGDLFPGVAIAPPEGTGQAAVQLSGTTLLSFTASGTATSGSIYLRARDGSQFAVRVLGATGRARVLTYLAARHEWVEGR